MATVEGILKDIERFRSGYTTNRWEFTYNDGTPVRKGIPYSIFYTKKKEEFYITDRENNKEFILKLHFADKTPFKKYKESKQGIIREIYLQPYQLVLTKKLKRQKTISRYFTKYIFDKYDRIFEIKKQDFNRETNLYDKVSLEWQLQGSKEDIILNNNKSLKEAEKILNGIKDFIDPLEFYEEEITPEDELQKKLSNLK